MIEMAALDRPTHVAHVGTRMLRRSEAMGVIRKLIQRGHDAANAPHNATDPEAFAVRRKQVAVLYEALALLSELSVFENGAVVPAMGDGDE